MAQAWGPNTFVLCEFNLFLKYLHGQAWCHSFKQIFDKRIRLWFIGEGPTFKLVHGEPSQGFSFLFLHFVSQAWQIGWCLIDKQTCSVQHKTTNHMDPFAFLYGLVQIWERMMESEWELKRWGLTICWTTKLNVWNRFSLSFWQKTPSEKTKL